MKKMHISIQKKLLAALLVCALISCTLPWQDASAQQDVSKAGGFGLSNPVMDSNGISTWDCIYFGSYWQNDTNGDGYADDSDDKEPIKWRVLSVDGDDVFLLSDRNLSRQVYNSLCDEKGVKWETSTIRSWLNGYNGEANICGQDYTDDNFLDAAFDEFEQAAIKDTLVVNTDNSSAFPDNGNDTTDKVYLLSVPEIMEESYGFISTWNKSKPREAKNTAYIDAGESKGDWWLRTISEASSFGDKACHIDGEGRLWRVNEESYVSDLSHTVRPALHLNLAALDGTSNLLWSYAGKITSDGKEIEAELPKPEVTTESPESGKTTESPEPEMTTESPESEKTTEAPESEKTTEAKEPDEQPPQDSSQQGMQNPIPVKVSSITVSGTIKKLAKGNKVGLQLTVEPIDAINRNVIWSSSNPQAADVDSNGIVTAKAAGTAVITAKAVDGSDVSGSYTIKVVKHKVQKIIIKAEKKKVAAGKKVKISATIKTSGKTANTVLSWTTSNKKYATVNSKGVVTTKKAGKGKTVTVTAMATDGSGKKDSIKIKIK